MKDTQQSIQSVTNLLNYFRDALQDAFADIGLKSSENTEAYLVHLLENFVRLGPDIAQEVGFEKPAAFLLGEAMNSPGEQRIVAYRRLGDVSLFNCGFFAAYLTRRSTVSPKYYRNVGRTAYRELSHLMMRKTSGDIFQAIYDELARNFDGFAQAFNHLGQSPDTAQPGEADDVLDKLRRGESLDLDDLKLAGLVPRNTEKKH